ncbi:unnamed protein product, partial [Brassica rapa subsp. trilocularis]
SPRIPQHPHPQEPLRPPPPLLLQKTPHHRRNLRHRLPIPPRHLPLLHKLLLRSLHLLHSPQSPLPLPHLPLFPQLPFPLPSPSPPGIPQHPHP